MTPRTRSSNKHTSYKVYYSKKVPQQVRFPHRRKTVRRPVATEQDEGEKRQLKFLPEKMRQQKDEYKDTPRSKPVLQGAAIEETTPTSRRKGVKRKGSTVQGITSSDEETENASHKRRRRTSVPKQELNHTLRRQSTMTQLADGRRPSTGADEPEFRPVKRPSRVSWSGTGHTKNEKDKKQRTLTQMIPGMGRLSREELEELSDLEAELMDDETEKDAVSQTLIEQGLLEVDVPTHTAACGQLSDDIEHDAVQSEEAKRQSQSAMSHEDSSVAMKFAGEVTGNHDEEDYQSTQFIDEPAPSARHTPQWAAAEELSNHPAEPGRSAQSRFGLLSTPEKRRIFEIPSSQSPAESVLSTQVSPERSRRSALREQNSNASLVAETPSKRRQVAFEEPIIRFAPPTLRKFHSTIQDSEDESESDLEGDTTTHDLADLEHQALCEDLASTGIQSGDRLAYRNKTADTRTDSQVSSEEIEGPIARTGPRQPSPELGESWAPAIFDDHELETGSYQISWRVAKSESQLFHDVGLSRGSRSESDRTTVVSQLDLTTQAVVLNTNISSTPPEVEQQRNENIPFTPMVLRDESSDEEGAGPEPKRTCAMRHGVHELEPTLVHPSADLDGELIQIPCSPPAECETQHSQSSRAEQQLQHEWLSYSQYVHIRAPNSSSMHAAIDASSNNATPRPSKILAISSPTQVQQSQATTVDEITPKKSRVQRVVNADTTPRRSSKTQSFISPEKPPSLFIPSSFPSPSRVAMESWSSPVATKTQNVYRSSQAMGSLEDFSIPLPPPIEDD